MFSLFALGLVVGRAADALLPSAAWFSVCSAACAVALCARGLGVRLTLAIAMLTFGAGWFTARLHELPPDSLAGHLPIEGALAERVPMTLDGVVLRAPRALPEESAELARFGFGARPAMFPLGAHTLHTSAGPAEIVGGVRVFASGMQPEALHAGQHVRLTGLVEAETPRRNPGEPARVLWSRQEGTVGVMRIGDPGLVEALPRSDSLAVRLHAAHLGIRDTLRERARAILLGPDTDGDDDAERALLAALILGFTGEPGLPDLRERFARLGIVHLIAISGFHLLVLTGAAVLLVRLTGDHGRWEMVIAALVVALYLLLVPSKPPVMRAGFMVLAMLGVEATGRRYDRVNSLAWIAVIALLYRPMDLWSLGFQLSYGLTAALLWIGNHVHDRLFVGPRVVVPARARPRSRWAPVREGFTRQFSASLLCWSLASALLMHSVGLFSPVAVVTTIVVFPFIALLLVGGYLSLGVGLLIPALAEPLSTGLASLAGVTLGLTRWIDGLPGSSLATPPVSGAWVAVATAVVLYWLVRGQVKGVVGWSLAAVAAGWLAAELALGPRLPSRVPFRVDALAVGDGSCHLLRSGGEALLWDCGSRTRPIGEGTVPRAVRALGRHRVPGVVITHADVDHYNALPELIEPLGIRRVYAGEALARAAAKAPGSAVARLLEILEEEGVEVFELGAGDTLTLGRATLTFLSPPAGAEWPEDNDHSLVARVDVATPGGGRSMLLTGDIEGEAIDHVLGSHAGMRTDVLEVPHHGSANEAAYELVTLLDPKVVVQSTGRRRVGDARWGPFRAGRVWLTTARDGAAWAEIRGDGSIRAGAMHRRAVTLR